MIARIEAFFGTHRVSNRGEHERERAFHRILVALLLGILIALDGLQVTGLPSEHRLYLGSAAVLYSASALAYRHFLSRNPDGGILLQYFYLLGDPTLLVLALVVDAERLAFLHSFLFLVIIRCGLRYGTRTMWLAWTITVIATSAFLPYSDYWRRETELTLSYLLLLVLVPPFFLSVVRRIHNVRAVEEERARMTVMQKVVATRSAFLAKVSHELRSPLQSIVSAFDVLEIRHGHGVTGDDELIGRIRRSSMLLNAQLPDLLTLARGEAGRLEMHPEPFEATALVESVVLAVRDSAREKGLALDLERPSGSVIVVADGSRIDQVLTNLVVNSVRYTLVGNVKVTLHTYDVAAKRLRFTVADTGPGIPSDRLPTLLEPGKRVAANERKGEGSGIGLAVVRTLVGHLGGDIAVSSLEGAGTRFDLSFPAEQIDPDDTVTSPSGDTGRVLIVDDREDILVGLGSVINELGFDCERALSTATAANMLATRRYDAVLIDIQMPGRSGAELAQEVRREQGPNKDTRLLGMSAADVAARYADGPFDACLPKPTDRNALISALREEWPETWPSCTV